MGLLVRVELQVHPTRPAGTKPLPVGLGDVLRFPVRLAPNGGCGAAVGLAQPSAGDQAQRGATLSGFGLAKQHLT